MSSWLDDTKQALRNLGGVARYSEIYAEVARIRNGPLPPTWDEIIRRTIQRNSSDSAAFNNNDAFFAARGIGGGEWGLREVLLATPAAHDVDDPPSPESFGYVVHRKIRDSPLSRRLKLLHNDRCQICGFAVPLSGGGTYSEGHHVKPLGHEGPDVAENILVLCPNHHAQCDYGAIRIDTASLHQHPEHRVEQHTLITTTWRCTSHK
jgi:hypothetical protein